jgi:hypothetical protein
MLLKNKFSFLLNAKKNKERLGLKGSWGHFALQYTLVCKWRWFEIASIKGVVPGSNFGREQDKQIKQKNLSPDLPFSN